MTNFDLLIPFGMLPAASLAMLPRVEDCPIYLKLLTKSLQQKQQEQQNFPAFSRSLPYQFWLADTFNLNVHNPNALQVLLQKKQLSVVSDFSPPFANAYIKHLIKDEAHALEGFWFLVQPVHFHITQHHVILQDPAFLQYSEARAQYLFTQAQSVFAERGFTLLYGDAKHWFLRADDWQNLQTATVEAASGHNIDLWMPQDSDNSAAALQWKKLQNEVQMLWFNEINQDDMRLPNALWLSCGASLELNIAASYDHIFANDKLTQSLASCADIPLSQLDEFISAEIPMDTSVLIVNDRLLSPWLNQAFDTWQQQLQASEMMHQALLTLIENQKIQLRLIIATQTSIITKSVSYWTLKQFWKTIRAEVLLEPLSNY